MPDPIVFDCGGSTRIKRLTSAAGVVGAMDKLVNVDDTLTPPQSQETVNDTFTSIMIVSLDRFGNAVQAPVNPIPVPTRFLIESDGGQSVQGDVTATSCTITVFGTANAPLVETKQFRRKRRYVVTNAGAIKKITVNGVVQFNTNANIIYVTLILS
jgi:hypothetical protein